MENKLCNYTGLTIGKKEPEAVTEKEIEDSINSLLARSQSYEEVERPSVENDTVNIDFEGFVDGVAFEGGKSEGYDLTLGSHTFIPGFEEQLIGLKKGEEKDVNVTFPEEYHSEELKGKKAVFKCKVNAVKVKKEATLDENFLLEHGCKDVDELKENIKKEIEDRNLKKELNRYFDALSQYLIENSEIEVTKEEEDKSYENVLAYYQQMVSMYQMSLEQYLQMANKTMDEFKEIIKPDVIKGAKINTIFKLIAQKENIIAEEDEIKNELSHIASYYGLNEEQLNEFKERHLEEFKEEIIKRKVSQFLITNNN